MIGLIVALKSEAQSFVENISDKKEILIANKPVITGKIEGKDVVLCICGIGKVNSALATQFIIDKFSPDYVINFGTAGGMNDSVKILNYYVIEKACQYDFDVSELDPVPVGYIQDFDTVFFNGCVNNINLEKSVVASGDRFNDNVKDISTINNMGASLRDMEGGSIAQVCTANNVPFIMIKGVTDVYGSKTAAEQFVSNLKKVSLGFAPIVSNIIKNI